MDDRYVLIHQHLIKFASQICVLKSLTSLAAWYNYPLNNIIDSFVCF